MKAGKAGKPGPARVRTTWALVDCEKAPWWNFLHVFDEFKLDEKLCKVSGDPDACLRYKNQNRKLPPGLDLIFVDDFKSSDFLWYSSGSNFSNFRRQINNCDIFT